MSQEWIAQLDDAELPEALLGDARELVRAVDILRPTVADQDHYQINFALKTVLRELLKPEEQVAHWWETGLYIVNQAALAVPEHTEQVSALTGRLSKALNARLGPYEEVNLVEVTSETVSPICLLSELVTYPQNTFVAPNAYSIAEAHFHPTAWFRAVYAGKAPVGFIMLDDNSEKPEYFLWRFMIAPQFQKRGFGAQAIARLIVYVRTRPNATELFVSYIDHEQGPGPFYAGLGFVETGDIEDGEVVARLPLA